MIYLLLLEAKLSRGSLRNATAYAPCDVLVLDLHMDSWLTSIVKTRDAGGTGYATNPSAQLIANLTCIARVMNLQRLACYT